MQCWHMTGPANASDGVRQLYLWGWAAAQQKVLKKSNEQARDVAGHACSTQPGSSVLQAARGFRLRGDLLADPFMAFKQQVPKGSWTSFFLLITYCSHGTSKVFNRVAIEAIVLLSIAAPVWALSTQQQQLWWGPTQPVYLQNFYWRYNTSDIPYNLVFYPGKHESISLSPSTSLAASALPIYTDKKEIPKPVMSSLYMFLSDEHTHL